MKSISWSAPRRSLIQSSHDAARLGVAGISLRGLAKLIDIAILYLILFAFVFLTVAAIILSGFKIPEHALSAPSWQWSVIWFLLLLAYFIPSEAISGCTIGKMICRLRVVKTDGKSCTFFSALLRNLLLCIDGGLIIIICFMNSPMNQRLGDMVAHTIVVSRNKTKLDHPWPFSRSLLGILSSCLFTAIIVMATITSLILR